MTLEAFGEDKMKLSRSAAEAVAVDALAFIANDDDLLSNFIAATGIDPASIRSALQKEDFLRGVMQYLVEDESLLTAFAASADLKPEEVAGAARAFGVAWQ